MKKLLTIALLLIEITAQQQAFMLEAEEISERLWLV